MVCLTFLRKTRISGGTVHIAKAVPTESTKSVNEATPWTLVACSHHSKPRAALKG